MRSPFSRTMLDARLPCRQSKTLYMGLAVVCRILQRDWPEADGEDVDETHFLSHLACRLLDFNALSFVSDLAPNDFNV